MPEEQASGETVSGADAIRSTATGLLRQTLKATGAAVDQLVARLKTDKQFRQFLLTQPFTMNADVDPKLLALYEQTLHGLCLAANDGLLQTLLEQMNELQPTPEEEAKGFRGGVEAAMVLLAARLPAPEPSDDQGGEAESAEDAGPEHPPPKKLVIP